MRVNRYLNPWVSLAHGSFLPLVNTRSNRYGTQKELLGTVGLVLAIISRCKCDSVSAICPAESEYQARSLRNLCNPTRRICMYACMNGWMQGHHLQHIVAGKRKVVTVMKYGSYNTNHLLLQVSLGTSPKYSLPVRILQCFVNFQSSQRSF